MRCYKTILLSLCLVCQHHNSYAEGVLISSSPKDNALISAFDNKVSYVFSGNISERSPSIVVLDSSGTRVDKQDRVLNIGNRSVLTATTQPLSAGRYTTRYRVVTEDGLIVSGITRFEIKE